MQEGTDVQVPFEVHLITYAEFPLENLYPIEHETEKLLKYFVYKIEIFNNCKFKTEKLADGSPQSITRRIQIFSFNV